ncbi:hypothetical protein QVD17_35786 [Tagetes erecta]|uniref:Uncharacterized protein n=1 Tax=Tagetes erecta TaxID=13708 RepID=A0AAD8NBE2_TARER|nr:hypothetical protein QVD17_35786 [Tagetes erecta]
MWCIKHCLIPTLEPILMLQLTMKIMMEIQLVDDDNVVEHELVRASEPAGRDKKRKRTQEDGHDSNMSKIKEIMKNILDVLPKEDKNTAQKVVELSKKFPRYSSRLEVVYTERKNRNKENQKEMKAHLKFERLEVSTLKKNEKDQKMLIE